MMDRVMAWLRLHFGFHESRSETEEHELVRQVESLKAVAATGQARVDRLTSEIQRVEAVVSGSQTRTTR